MQFLLLLLRRFKDFDQAFTFIDGVHGNSVINLKEMTERVQRMGYREFQGTEKRLDGTPMALPGTAGAQSIPLIQKLFRYLDPDNSGSISRKDRTKKSY